MKKNRNFTGLMTLGLLALLTAALAACSLGSPSSSASGTSSRSNRQLGYPDVPFNVIDAVFESVDAFNPTADTWPQIRMTLQTAEGFGALEELYDELRIRYRYDYWPSSEQRYVIESTFIIDLRGDLDQLSINEVARDHGHDFLADEFSFAHFDENHDLELKLVFDPMEMLRDHSAGETPYHLLGLTLEGVNKTSMIDGKPLFESITHDFAPVSYCDNQGQGIYFVFSAQHQYYVMSSFDVPRCELGPLSLGRR